MQRAEGTLNGQVVHMELKLAGGGVFSGEGNEANHGVRFSDLSVDAFTSVGPFHPSRSPPAPTHIQDEGDSSKRPCPGIGSPGHPPHLMMFDTEYNNAGAG